MDDNAPIGFIGLGIMGRPMALNLLRAGHPLVVWNRSPEPATQLAAEGATVASDVAEVFSRCRMIILMLADEPAVDTVLRRGTTAFAALVRDRIVVQMGTFSPGFSSALAAEVTAAGGQYVEAPVSGSRGPATEGTLVAMLAGEPSAVAGVAPVIDAMCAQRFDCGPIPGALSMKLAVNIFLITMVTGLAESFQFALRNQLDPGLLRDILDAGPMASAVSRGKAALLVAGDFPAQAAIADVLKNCDLVHDAAVASGAADPLLRDCRVLFREAVALGLPDQDMAAVIKAIAARSETGALSR
ncbi:NAD(P)-dependent oxidoreductase [Microlunatus sp. GCM10028923]|uniref:NAD(P)-dependent oxidoreductase n=1 Tax=Microlunatus sp. GCM10028923 TaxID=3273400 RepID=UPI00360695D8